MWLLEPPPADSSRRDRAAILLIKASVWLSVLWAVVLGVWAVEQFFSFINFIERIGD